MEYGFLRVRFNTPSYEILFAGLPFFSITNQALIIRIDGIKPRYNGIFIGSFRSNRVKLGFGIDAIIIHSASNIADVADVLLSIQTDVYEIAKAVTCSGG
jgi:hypothetical protein